MKILVAFLILLLTAVGATPFIADKYVSSKIEEVIAEKVASYQKTDATATLTYEDVKYDIFDSIFTITGISFYSVKSGLEIEIGEYKNSIDYSDLVGGGFFQKNVMPEVSSLKKGTLKIRESMLEDRHQKLYVLMSGKDKKIEFSSSSKTTLSEDGELVSKSNLFVENTGTLDLNLRLNGLIEPNNTFANPQDYAMENLKAGLKITEFNLSFVTNNTKNLMNNIFNVLDYVDSEQEVSVELNKLADKMDEDEDLRGFAKPIRDLSMSYETGKQLKLTVATMGEISTVKVIGTAIISGTGRVTPAEIANHLQLKVTSSTK